jgi:hypothetical protein
MYKKKGREMKTEDIIIKRLKICKLGRTKTKEKGGGNLGFCFVIWTPEWMS